MWDFDGENAGNFAVTVLQACTLCSIIKVQFPVLNLNGEIYIDGRKCGRHRGWERGARAWVWTRGNVGRTNFRFSYTFRSKSYDGVLDRKVSPPRNGLVFAKLVGNKLIGSLQVGCDSAKGLKTPFVIWYQKSLLTASIRDRCFCCFCGMLKPLPNREDTRTH